MLTAKARRSQTASDSIDEFFTMLAEPGHLATFAGESATLRFDIADGGKVKHWYVTVTNGHVTVSRGSGKADVVVRVDRPHMEEIVTGRLNAHAAMFRGLVQFNGEVAALMMFQRCLPGPPGSTGKVRPISSETVTAQRRAM